MLDQIFRNMTPVVKNLLILNVLFFIAQFALPDIMSQMALYPVGSENFRPWQLATHFFMHDTRSIGHIFFNMFGLYIFGISLEKFLGPKKFLIYYFSTAMGAVVLYSLVVLIRISFIEVDLGPDFVFMVRNEGYAALLEGMNFNNESMANLNSMINTPMIGASGAIVGLAAGFGFLFADSEFTLFLLPIRIKAIYYVGIYITIELYQGFANRPFDNVAHFAHLGGALIGILTILYWKRKDQNIF